MIIKISNLYDNYQMHREFRYSLRLRAFTWNAEAATLRIVYRNNDEITFFNISEETAKLFVKVFFKVRFIQIMKTNPIFPFNYRKV